MSSALRFILRSRQVPETELERIARDLAGAQAALREATRLMRAHGSGAIYQRAFHVSETQRLRIDALAAEHQRLLAVETQCLQPTAA